MATIGIDPFAGLAGTTPSAADTADNPAPVNNPPDPQVPSLQQQIASTTVAESSIDRAPATVGNPPDPQVPLPQDVPVSAGEIDFAANPTNFGATIQRFDDGSAFQTFDDGSTLATTADGNFTSSPAAVDNANYYAEQAGPPSEGNVDVAGAEAAANAAKIAAGTQLAQQQTAIATQRGQKQNGDWRVRLQLAPQSNYLYNDPNPGILQPLRNTNGVIFPYTPKIDMSYRANYQATDITHSNYKNYFYQSSEVSDISLTAHFTAQSTSDANYVLAVIHFFRTATKMFYGQDAQRGSPPPMVFLSGYGDYQFNNHACLIADFGYSLPDDVDYIRAQATNITGLPTANVRARQTVATNNIFASIQRLSNAFTTKGALPPTPYGTLPGPQTGIGNPTYVPTKLDITLKLIPVVSRQKVSQQFSVKNFANGNLLKGGFW